MEGTFFDGHTVKGFNIPMSYDSDIGWDVYGKKLEDAELYQRVSVVFRAFNLNAHALASIPFALVDSAGNDWDVSTDWQNKLGFMPNPRKFMRLWRKSLSMTNTAYGMFEGQGRNVSLRYIVPTTMTPDIDRENGLQGFWRQIPGRRSYYPLNSNKILYLFNMDYDTEVAPSENTEFAALMQSAGILYYADYFVKDYFKRGAIPAHIFGVKGQVDQAERERIENIITRLMRGMKNAIGKVWQAEALDIKKIGTGVDDLKDNPVYDRAIDNIASVTGIPKRILIGSERGDLASSQDTKNWFMSVVQWAELMQEELNEKLFTRMGLRLDFRPEQAEPDQETEAKRSQAFVNYAGVLQRSGNPRANSIAAQVVGVDLPPDMEYDDLDERDESRLPQNPFQQQQNDLPKPEVGQNDPQNKSVFIPNPDQFRELDLWSDAAVRRYKRDEWPFAWQAKYLPADIVGMIQEKLDDAENLREVKAAFVLTDAPEYRESDEIKVLADAMNKFADAVSHYTAVTNITVPPVQTEKEE